MKGQTSFFDPGRFANSKSAVWRQQFAYNLPRTTLENSYLAQTAPVHSSCEQLTCIQLLRTTTLAYNLPRTAPANSSTRDGSSNVAAESPSLRGGNVCILLLRFPRKGGKSKKFSILLMNPELRSSDKHIQISHSWLFLKDELFWFFGLALLKSHEINLGSFFLFR